MSKLGAWLQRPATAWWAGVIWPIIMLIADPIIFKGDFMGDDPAFAPVTPACYSAIFLGMYALAHHLTSKPSSAVIAGVLATATLFATVLGVAMLPMSAFGTLFFGYGLLGLSPFFTALAFSYQARRAFREAPRELRIGRFMLGVVLYVGACGLVQWRVGTDFRVPKLTLLSCAGASHSAFASRLRVRSAALASVRDRAPGAASS